MAAAWDGGMCKSYRVSAVFKELTHAWLLATENQIRMMFGHV